MAISRERKFWLWYAAAYLPTLAFYFFAFSLQSRKGAGLTALASLGNLLPDAVLGAGLVHVCRPLWRRDDRRRLALYLVGLGVAFIGITSWLKISLNMLLIRFDGGSVDWSSYDRGILLWQAFLSLLGFAVLVSVSFGVSAAARLREEEARRSQADLSRVRAELKALRAQVNPHFLFNTLHSVRALIQESPDSAEEAVEQLGDLLRYALRIQDAADDGVLLREEWDFLRAYVALEKLRLGDRLRVEEDVSDAALQSIVPAFVLQPLVENAIRHGIAARERGGTVWIRAQLEDGALCLQVRDDGPGASGLATKGMGKGLDLVRQRLGALYGAAGSVEVASAPASGFSVTLRFPGALESW